MEILKIVKLRIIKLSVTLELQRNSSNVIF